MKEGLSKNMLKMLLEKHLYLELSAISRLDSVELDKQRKIITEIESSLKKFSTENP